MKSAVALFATFIALFSGAADAYTVNAGDVVVRAVTGASVNVARLDVATKATPPAGLLVGIDLDWSIDGNWALAASLRPVLSPGFVDCNLGLGAKYRVLQWEAPLIPYFMGQVTTAVGGPLGYGDMHFNLGGRVGTGIEYFVMRDLALSVEIGTEVSGLLTPLNAVEWSADALAGVSWRW